MKAPFVHGPGDLRLDEIELPHAGPRDVVLQVATVGICGSDLGYAAVGGIAGPGENPVPLGHELSGVIAETGGEVAGFENGDRVILNPYFNAIGNGGPEGGFAEFLLVRDVVGQPDSLLRLPDSVSFDQGALVEPLAVSFHAVNRAKVGPGDTVAVFGAGPIGLGIVIGLRRRGVEDIAVFDLSPLRRQLALKLGARKAFDPRQSPPREALAELHGTMTLWSATPLVGTKVFIEASGAPNVIPEIVDCAGFHARLIVVAVQKKPVPLDFQTLLGKEMSIEMAMGYPNEFAEVLGSLASGGIDAEGMVTHRFDGTDFMSAFKAARQQDQAAKVLVKYKK
jgi:(R,R)-butanediol dehydrogenase/meso-butanediol dehydrogenase/diacetyl reductase